MTGIYTSCLRVPAAMFVVFSFALPATQAARADMYSTLTEDTCWVTTATTDEALKAKKYREAIAGYTKAIDWTAKTCGQTLAAKNVFAKEELKKSHLGRAIAATGQGDYDLAVRDIALLLDADFEGLWKIRPHMRALFNNDSMAQPAPAVFLDWTLGVVNKAIERNPKTSVYRAARADIYEKREDFQEALAERNAQVEYAQNNEDKARAYYDRAFTRYRIGDKEGRLADLSSGIGFDPEPEARRYADRAALYKQFGRIDEAIADYTKAMSDETANRYKDYLKARADLYRENGKLDAAAKDFEKLVALNAKNADYLYGLLLVRTQQGDARQAKRLRAQIDKLKPDYLDNPERACELATAGPAPTGPAIPPATLRDVWSMGEVAALAPIQHLIGKPNATIDKAWDVMSNLVRAEQKAAGEPPRGLAQIPKFDGSKSDQLKQTIGFIFRQAKVAEAALEKKYGKRAAAVFAVSNAGYLAATLNGMGVPNVNVQLGKMIAADAPASGLPCGVWADTVAKIEGKAKPAEITKTWDTGRKTARELLADPAPKPEKKSEAAPEKPNADAKNAAAETKPAKSTGLRECDDQDIALLLEGADPNTMPPCDP